MLHSENKAKLLPRVRVAPGAAGYVSAGDWVDVRDPNVIAETELLQAAASIEAAAKKLAELKPPPKVVC